MFGIGFGEILIIAIIALLLLGPDKLPEAAKTLGKTLREVRRATEDLKDQVEREIYSEDKPAKPALVPPVAVRPIPGPAGPPPPATADNVPGLEAALAEPAAPTATPGAEPVATVAEESSPPPAAPTGTQSP